MNRLLEEINKRLDLLLEFNKFITFDKYFTYVTSGNGLGEIRTITYKNSNQDIIHVTVFTYDSNNKILSIVNI